MKIAGIFFPLVVLAMLPLLRSGHWRWDVLAPYGQPILRSALIHNTVVWMFWLGWFTSLILGLLVFFGAAGPFNIEPSPLFLVVALGLLPILRKAS